MADATENNAAPLRPAAPVGRGDEEHGDEDGQWGLVQRVTRGLVVQRGSCCAAWDRTWSGIRGQLQRSQVRVAVGRHYSLCVTFLNS